MKRTDLIDRRFDELLEHGTQILTTRRPPPPNVVGDDRIDLDKSQQWATSSSQFLRSIFGGDSEYYARFQKAFKYAGYYSDMTLAVAVLKAAWNDYSKGFLVEAKSLVRARCSTRSSIRHNIYSSKVTTNPQQFWRAQFWKTASENYVIATGLCSHLPSKWTQ
jgi:hypothetical protein